MELDIRDEDTSIIDTIRVHQRADDMVLADILVKGNPYEDSCCWIEDSVDKEVLGVTDKEHAQNLIKGLQKAIDLGWFD